MANAYTLGFFSLRGSEFSKKSSTVVFSWGLEVVVVEAGGGISVTTAASGTSVFLSVFLLNISIALSKASTI